MNVAEAATRIGQLLEADGLEYAIGGALALGVWGAPRGTKDVDLSVFATPPEYGRVADAFERVGVVFDRIGAERDLGRIGFFRGRLGRIHIDVFMSAHPHFDSMRARRRRIEAPGGQHLYFISAEDLCVMKLVYARDKDFADLERLFAVQPQLDMAYIRQWVRQLPVGDDALATLEALDRRFRAPRGS
ncbi:MAG: hypothetical protein H0T89_37035 [Deltaproteobacteria bacterium]|nr:hypothetical protein [Deltaproteobacteria bacterium]MDQ3296520.1 hypothetical protein [Myxococcota bacterium]